MHACIAALWDGNLGRHPKPHLPGIPRRPWGNPLTTCSLPALTLWGARYGGGSFTPPFARPIMLVDTSHLAELSFLLAQLIIILLAPLDRGSAVSHTSLEGGWVGKYLRPSFSTGTVSSLLDYACAVPQTSVPPPLLSFCLLTWFNALNLILRLLICFLVCQSIC